MEFSILQTGILIFFARVCDVSLGTVRTIVTVQGRSVLAFFLGLFEVLIWITIVSTVVLHIKESPILVVFYAFGYATGNVVGILVERKLAFGLVVLRVITTDKGGKMAERLRNMGLAVTVFLGEGMNGTVTELYMAIRRKDLTWVLSRVKEEDPDAFYITEQARDVSKSLKPISTTCNDGWSLFKK
ncbi:MAG: DUF2179 domain-containing protein [Deltaproteobacteria bacterium]|nr:DUF2179 domain-containing protein [Deltaproteobacteria bacterium]